MSAIPKAHSYLGASTCERWYNCPGSVSLIGQAPPSAPSKYAAEGTVAHTLAAQKLDTYLNREPSTKLRTGSIVSQDTFDIKVTAEMQDAVNEYIEYVTGVIERFDLRNHDIFVEQRICIPGVQDAHKEELLWGTADCVLHVPYRKLVVVDYKHGAGVKVASENNKQLMYYALGALLKLPDALRDELTVVEMVIVQPRAPGGGVDVSVFEVDQLLEFHKDLVIAAYRTMKADAPVVAGAWCKFCPAKVICPALQERVATDAGLDFSEIKALPAISKPMLPAPAALSPDVIANVLNHADTIKAWLDAVHDEGYRLANLGTEIPGYQLVKKRANRQWINEDEARLVLEAALGKEAVKVALKSPKQIEDLLKKRPDIDVHLGILFETPDNGTTLSPIKEKGREAAKPAALADFSNV